MDADHSHVCKFSDPDGEDYSPVWRSILKMSKQAVERSKARGHVKSVSKLF